DTGLCAIARPLAHVKVQLGAETIAVALRIRPVEQRDAVEDVAVDHRDRSSVLHLLYGVQEKGRRNAVERGIHAIEAAAANGELAAKIVAGRDPRQHLDRAHGIISEEAPEVLNLGAAERLLRGHRFLLPLESLGRD